MPPRRATVRRPDAGREDARFAVQLGGPAGGRPLLLLPGQANSHVWWDGLRERFEDSWRTVTFDYRGTGETVADLAGADEWTTRSFAEDAAYVMASLGLARFDVYGTSMGGRVAQHLAAAHPDRVGGLVLACTSPGGPHSHERSRTVRRILAGPSSPERTEAVLRFFYTPQWLGTARDSHLLGDPTMTPEAARGHLLVSNRHDAWEVLPRIVAPTLVLHGSEDPMVPTANAQLFATRIPHARTHVHPGRHGFFDEFADEVTPLIRDFLEAEADSGDHVGAEG